MFYGCSKLLFVSESHDILNFEKISLRHSFTNKVSLDDPLAHTSCDIL